jgi:pyruvate kinase
MRRAKIVATLGPATSSYEQIKAIIDAGVDVARMNLSHGSHEVHEGIYRTVRKAASDAGKSLGIFVDLQGPKIRLARFKDGPHDLSRGDVFTITTDFYVFASLIHTLSIAGLFGVLCYVSIRSHQLST